jgi:hypothetical protein
MVTVRFVVFSHDLAASVPIAVAPPTGWTVAASHARFVESRWQPQAQGPQGAHLPSSGGMLNTESGWAHALDFTSPLDFQQGMDAPTVWPNVSVPAGIAVQVGTPNPPPKPPVFFATTHIKVGGADGPNPASEAFLSKP